MFSFCSLQVFHGLSLSIMRNVFHRNTSIPCKLRSRSELYSRNPKTIKYGTETISDLAPKIWSLVPEAIKRIKSLDVFKSTVRQWEPGCPCRLCKIYLQIRFHLVFHYLLFQKYHEDSKFNPLRTTSPAMISVLGILASYLDTSAINYNMI